MSSTRAQIVSEAREWLSTPFVHQGRLKGQASDCAGLVVGVALKLGLVENWSEVPYGRQPNPKRMGEILGSFMLRIPITDILDGDVYWFRFIDPMHVGIAATLPDGRKSVIHCWQDQKKCVEHGLDDTWRKRIEAGFRFYGVTE